MLQSTVSSLCSILETLMYLVLAYVNNMSILHYSYDTSTSNPNHS